MGRRLIRIRVVIAALALALATLTAQQQPSTAGGRGDAAPGRGAVPGRGGRGPVAIPVVNEDPLPRMPLGFAPIFNGKDTTGWHIAKVNQHGNTADYHVIHGSILIGTQSPLGQGGILLTDKKYKNVEVYMEVKPDWGCDSGIFLRTDENGHGYQVMLDYLPGGTMVSGLYGEGIQGVNMNGPGWDDLTSEQRTVIQQQRTEAWQRAWKREEWNSVRVRVVGNPPHITSWLNEQIMFDGTDTANHATDGAERGSIAIQVHGQGRWRAGGFWRWRVIAVKELPD
jgi:hypothetical protein